MERYIDIHGHRLRLETLPKNQPFSRDESDFTKRSISEKLRQVDSAGFPFPVEYRTS